MTRFPLLSLRLLFPLLASLLPCLPPRTASAANGSIYQPLAGFPASLANPVRGRLTLHTDGNFYGGDSNIEGGGPGLLYRISPDGRVAAVARLVYPLDGFTGITRPSERLVSDAAGRLWGIASKPSSAAIAAIFHFTPASGQYVEVIEFNTLPSANFSTVPVSNLVPDGQGHFWFLTVTNNFEKGVKETSLHRLDPASGALTLLSTVPGEQEAAPDLVADGLGFLWGQSPNGNGNVDGSIYKISVSTGIRTTVATFGWDRGRRPVGGLSPDGKGFFWGTTAEGGIHGMGTVYKVETATGALTTVTDIPDTVTGGGIKTSRPSTALCADGRGWMWGTTDQGGISMGSGYFGAGTVFKVNIQTGEFRTVVMFTDADGAFPGRIPSTGLILAPDGKLRGMTERGGPGNRGMVYAIDPATDTWSLVTGLGGVGAPGLGAPATALTADSQGLLWGGADIADQGGHGTLGYGGLYTLDPRTGEVTRRLVFTGRTGSAKGTALDGGLTMDNQGRLWGFSRHGGGADFGTVFRVDPASGVLTTVRDFTGASDGRYPGGAPFLDGQGNIWGVTRGDYGGGEASLGTVFKIHTDTGAFTTVTTFTGATGAAVGLTPNPGLASDGLGSIWGTTFYGGTEVRGSLFKLDAGSGAFTNIRDFGITPATRPAHPRIGLASDGLGFLWGVTEFTGTTNGTIYKINAATGAFTGISEPPGSVAGNLVHDGAGWMWGTANGEIIYKTARDTHRTVILQHLTGLGGAAPGGRLPSAAMLKHTDGHFYGVAQRGGVLADGSPAGRGQIFRLHLGPLPRTLPPAFVSATMARIPGTVHSNDTVSQVFLDYGTDPALTGSLTLPVAAPAVLDREQPVTAMLRGLAPATTYHYRLRAVNPDNANPQTGEILSFTTPARGLAPWLAAHGLTGAAALPGADPDADGLPNALEYALGADPRQPSPEALPRLTGLDGTGGGVGAGQPALEFHRALDAAEDPGISLAVETSTDLTLWQSLKVGKTTADSGPGVSVESSNTEFDLIRCPLAPAQAGKSFVRLRAVVSGVGEG